LDSYIKQHERSEKDDDNCAWRVKEPSSGKKFPCDLLRSIKFKSVL